MEKVVFIGAGGHCRNIISFYRYNGSYAIYGVTDPFTKEENILNFPVLGPDEILPGLFHEMGVSNAFITVGGTGDNSLRAKLYDRANVIGFNFINIIHETSIVSNDLNLGRGNLLLAGSIINSSVHLGDNNIINTGAILEHDVRIGSHVHIAPRSVLGGGVEVGDLSHIGIGATVIQGVKIGKNALIGAGSVVLHDVPDNSVVVGVPAKLLKVKGGKAQW